MSLNWFPALGSQKIDMVLIFLRGNLRLDLAAHPHNRFFRNGCRHKECFARHPKIALRLIRRNAPFIAEGDQNFFPRKTVGDPCDLGINRARCVSAGKRDPKLVPLRQRFVPKIGNEICRVGDEFFRADNPAAHARTKTLVVPLRILSELIRLSLSRKRVG